MESKVTSECGKEDKTLDADCEKEEGKEEEGGSTVADEDDGNDETTVEESNDDDKTFPSNSSNSEETATDSPDEPGQSSGFPPSSSRLMRNLAEKMRRDKLNMYISELSSLVPIVAMATKRMDKTSVLRLSANFLRIHLSLKQDKDKTKAAKPQRTPGVLESSLSSTLLEALEGFMLIITSSGKIVYVSETVEKLLGHSQLDLMGQSLYTICHNGDTELLRHHLQPSTEFNPAAGAEDGSDGGSSVAEYVPRSPSFFGGRPEETFSGLAAGERRSFYVRLTERSMARGDPARHVTVHLNGILRPPAAKPDGSKTPKGKKETTSTGSGDEHLLVCVARPFRNKGITELSLMEAVQDEYVTRHLPDGRIIYSDHRIAFVAGYLTEEVMGMSAFNFIHQEDVPWATVANRQMFSSVEGQGYSVYRLRSKTGSLIHLRTRGFLEFNKTTQKVETFVCINTLLTNEEGDKELEKERERIMPFITFQQVTTTTSSTSTNAVTGASSICSSEEESSVVVATGSEEDLVQPPLSTLESNQDNSSSSQSATELLPSLSSSQPSSPIVLTTMINASVDIALLSALGRGGTGPPSQSSSCSIVDVTTDEIEDQEPPISPLDTKPDAAEFSPGSTHATANNGDLSTNHHHHHQTDFAESLTLVDDDPISSPSTAPPLSSPHSTAGMGSPGDSAPILDSSLDQIHQTLIYVTQSPPPPTLLREDSLSPLPAESLRTRTSHGTPPTPGNLFPRLKRSLAEVEDLGLVSSSAKRSILPSNFLASYNPLHRHSAHLGNKWGAEKTTTIIFDQHNNNG